MAEDGRSPTDNDVVAQLPEARRDALIAAGKVVAHKSGSRVQVVGEPITEFVLPITGLISLTMDASDGQSVEVAVVGAEGVVGIMRFLGATRSQWGAVAQVPGDMLHVPLDAFELDGSDDGVRQLVDGLVASLMIEVAQSALCNKLHMVDQRTARWLLHASDRARTKDLQLTHEFLAQMLAVRRPSVTSVVGLFSRAGLITTRRGRLGVADRDGLREIACECYEVVRAATPKIN
jgi:CRP-like cAMP-binding protein